MPGQEPPDEEERREPGRGGAGRDRAALSLVVDWATRSGVLQRMRDLPPATIDRVARALDWDLDQTRATLQALTAAGLVERDTDLATWSLTRNSPMEQLLDRSTEPLPDLERALADPTADAVASLDEPPIEVLSELVLPAEPELCTALERGARVIGLAGSDRALSWLRERFPRIQATRLSHPTTVHRADLVLHLSPLDLPGEPDRFLASVVRCLDRGGLALLRALREPLAPVGRCVTHKAERLGWWHALAVVSARAGGSGSAWSLPVARQAAHVAGCPLPTVLEYPQDSACVHLVLRNGGAPGSSRPRPASSAQIVSSSQIRNR